MLARRNDAKRFEKKKQAKPVEITKRASEATLVVSREPNSQPDKLFLAPVLQSVVQNKKSQQDLQ